MIALLTALTVFFPCAGTIHAEDARRTVKVGYFSNGDFLYKNSAGDYEGYDVEYDYTLAQYANWNIQFLDFSSLVEAETALQNGEIDLLSGLSKTAEREENFLFSASKSCTTATAVQVRRDDERFSLSDTASLSEMSCGIIQNSILISLYENWCSTLGITAHITLFENATARDQALMDGTIDAIAAGSTVEGAQKIAQFPAFDIYFVMNKANTALKKELDNAMVILAMEAPGFASDLFDKYFPLSKNTTPSFSKAEQEFIEKHSVIRVGLQADNEPYSSGKTGQMKGFLPEYYNHLAEIIGVHFQYVSFEENDSMLQALKNHEIDIIGRSEKDAFSAVSNNLEQSNAFMSVSLVQMNYSRNTRIRTVAVPKFNLQTSKNALDAANSDVSLLICDNNEECMQALQNGKADSILLSSPAVSYFLSKNRASDYVVSALGGVESNSCISMNQGEDGNLLRSIFNKVLAVDSGAFNELINEDLQKESRNISNIFNQLPVSTIVSLTFLFFALLLIVIIALFIILHRHKVEKNLAMEQASVAADMERNKARHAFFGAVSHDMRTPLNGIMGFTDLALKSEDPAVVKSYLKKIHTSGETLDLLVNDTLLMSRLENNQYILTPVPTNLEELMQGVILPIQQTAAENQIHFVDATATVCKGWYNIDQISLQKVFMNLLTNAIKFSHPGGTVQFLCEKDQNAFIFMVVDDGIGIDQKFQAHMFEPFTQEDTAKSKAMGSGLGLSIVKSIVDAMHGNIHVSSKKGIGTTFIVRLPMEPCEPPEKKTETSTRQPAPLVNKHALICEDNELNMEIEASILANAGMVVTRTVDGRQGVEAFRQSSEGYYDIILMDLRMPVMDGLSAAKKIRELPRPDAKTVLIYAVSADAYQENIIEAIDAGMNGHISKPIHAEVMLQTISQAINKGI
jgi:signal transduction histidine kinase/ActR/RegA family two-component response regulator